MAKLISGTYGEALFELAVEEKAEDAFLEESIALAQVLKVNQDLNKVMNHPKIMKEEKKSTLEQIFKGRIREELLGFLLLVVEKDRYDSLDDILSYFINKMKEHKGIGTAYVQTAVSLTEQQKNEVEKRLLETTKYQKVEVIYEVDESLIGGMVIRIKDRVLDSSIRSKLTGLERDLMKIQLA